jgi:cell division protein FtsW
MPRQLRSSIFLDKYLIISVASLLVLGIIMVASASIPITERMQLPFYYFALNQITYVVAGLILLVVTSYIPLKIHRNLNMYYLVLSVVLLVLILIPGVTRPINGSLRWFFLGPISIQPSEIAKLSFIMYMAGYMVRRDYQLKNYFSGFVIPMIVLGFVCALLLLEPDFGAAFVITLTSLGMMFLAGAKFRYFLTLLPLVATSFGILALSSSYRLQRFIAFRDPWSDQFNNGYQLVQSLIAFGRGGVFGVGLGKSLQKLLYLPEAHSDFIFAILAEELGLLVAFGVILLFGLLFYRAIQIGKRAQTLGFYFESYIAYGIGLWVMLQASINIGVNMGVFPTKGITLPLVSSGGSSMLIMCISLGLLFRVDYEIKKKSHGRYSRYNE